MENPKFDIFSKMAEAAKSSRMFSCFSFPNGKKKQVKKNPSSYEGDDAPVEAGTPGDVNGSLWGGSSYEKRRFNVLILKSFLKFHTPKN